MKLSKRPKHGERTVFSLDQKARVEFNAYFSAVFRQQSPRGPAVQLRSSGESRDVYVAQCRTVSWTRRQCVMFDLSSVNMRKDVHEHSSTLHSGNSRYSAKRSSQ